jgi:putative nucleotidyltransferase with HDIG domain
MITKDDIQKLFSAQLAKITDAKLRDQVVAVWVAACKQGGWETVDQLEAMPFTLLTETHGINFIEHTIAVTDGAEALGKAQQATYRRLPYRIDMDRLIAGGLLHDVGKLLEIESDGAGGWRKSRNGMCARHPISGAILVGAAGLSDELVNTVACHAKEGDGRPQVIETVLIHQADFATFNPLVMLQKGHLIQ